MKILMMDLENIQEAENIFHPGKRSRMGGRAAGFCVTPDHRLLREDMRWIEAGRIQVGDVVLGFDEELSGNKNRNYRKATVTRSTRTDADVYKVVLSSGKVFRVTGDHKWLVGYGQTNKWVTTDGLVVKSPLKEGSKTARLFDMWKHDRSYESGWLSGFLDGEGYLGQRSKSPLRLAASQNPGVTADLFMEMANTFVTTTARQHRKGGQCLTFEIGTSKKDRMKFLGEIRPQRFLNKLDFDKLGSLTCPADDYDEVVEVTHIGVLEVAEITTTTGTFICDGYPMHNCADLAYILNFGYKWFEGGGGVIGPDKKKFKSVPHDIRTIDKELVEKALKIIEEADLLVTWYGSGHDMKFLRARAAQYGLVMPNVQHVDLYKTYSKMFPMSSSRLGSAADFLQIGMNKQDIDKVHWPRCWFGDVKSLDIMAEYCYQDVVVLEEVYKKLLPHINNHPSVAVNKGVTLKSACPNCGSNDTIARGSYVTATSRKRRRSCNCCGTWFKGETM
jgi:hypothetical protein